MKTKLPTPDERIDPIIISRFPNHLLCAQHGILTFRRAVTFPERLEAHVSLSESTGIEVLTDQYDAGPFPRINMLRKNARIAKAQALVIDHWCGLHHYRTGKRMHVSFLGHSNGCDVVRRTAINVHKMGHRVNAIIHIAAPLSPSIQKQGLEPLTSTGTLLENWYSPNDTVLAKEGSLLGSLARWPYSNAGRIGLKNADTQIDGYDFPTEPGLIINRRFTGGHSEYFESENERLTFDTIIRSIELAAG